MHNIHSIELKRLTCCYCLKVLTPDERNNLVQTEFQVTWSYPVVECALDQERYAVAFHCDQCKQEKRPVIRVPEYIPKHKVTRYHLVTDLQRMQAFKNEQDLQRMRQAHQIPGVAEFWAIIDNVTITNVTRK